MSDYKASTRMPPLPEAALDEAQRAAVEAFFATRGKHLAGVSAEAALAGPWSVFIRSPELMGLTQSMGEYLRYRCAIAGRLGEIAILLTARHWTQDFEWFAHARMAAREGVPDAVIAAIRDGRRPDGLEPDDGLVYDFVTELLTWRRVSDTTYARAAKRFGEGGVVDICGVVGYYSLLAMTMNVARVQTPDDAERMSRFPE